MIFVERLDHFVLTVADIDATCNFYETVLGCEVVQFCTGVGPTRYALRMGNSPQKINLHPADGPFEPSAHKPQPGSADFCFITSVSIVDVMQHLQSLAVPIIAGPVQRTGTLGPILSVYVRDPDGNLVEIANALHKDLDADSH
ncbi:MAG: VOC family protein [Cyanobacteria bacterium J06598_3]